MSQPMWMCHECGIVEVCRDTDRTPEAAHRRILKMHNRIAKRIAPCKGVPTYHAGIEMRGRIGPA